MQESLNITSTDIIFILILLIVITTIVKNHKKEKQKIIKIVIKNNNEHSNNIQNTAIQLTKNFKEITSSFYKKNVNQLSNLIDKNLLTLIKTEIKEKEKELLKESRVLIDVESTKITKKFNNKIIVEFSSIQTSHFIDNNGNIKKGNKNKIIKVKDFWLFKKNSKNKWILEEVLDIKNIKN